MGRGAEPIPLHSGESAASASKLTGAEPGSFGQMNGHTDATLTAVPTDELRRRAADGDQQALVEKARREAQEAAAA